MRLSYSTDIKIIRVPCTGKVDILHILRAIEKGADGVYLVGCLEGDCRYKTGNLNARKRVEQAGVILNNIGISGDRVQMYNLSSGEGPKFVQFAEEMEERIRALGPSPVRTSLQKKEVA